jgi:hypothetical protein
LALLELFGGANGFAETTAAERAASARVNFIFDIVNFSIKYFVCVCANETTIPRKLSIKNKIEFESD